MKKKLLILLAFIGIVIVYHIFCYVGHYGYDDLEYAQLANSFNNGIIDFNNHFSFRTPIIFLTSISYRIFGISDFSSSLPTIILTILILAFVFKILENKGERTLIIGLALTTLSNWFIFYSDKLMPDIYIAFSVICSLFIIHWYRYDNSKNRVFLPSFLLVISLLFGFMSKGTIILILPLLIYYSIIDILQKRNTKFWIYTTVIGIVILSLYFYIVWLVTGDLLKRLHSITSNSYLNLCSYNEQSIIILLKRLAYQFWQLTVYQGIVTGFVFIIAYLIGNKSLGVFKMNNSFSFWTSSSIVLLLSSNFMTISLSSYSPMCLDPRHYLFLIPIVAIPASSVIIDFIENRQKGIIIVALSGIIALFSIFLQGNSFWSIYIPLFILLLAYLFVKNNNLNQKIFISLFIVILLIKPFTMGQYAQKIDYRKQKETFIEQLQNSNENTLVITNNVQKRLANYYSEFKEDKKLNIVDYKEFKYDSLDTRNKILFMNGHTRYLSGISYDNLPYYAKNILPSNKLLYENSDLNISVYKMNDFSIPEKNGKLLYSSLNGFEGKVDNWNQHDRYLTKDVKYAGEYSFCVKEYSSTFEYYVDSLNLSDFEKLFIRCSVYCNYKDATSSKLIISVENDENAYVWNGIEINKYLKAFSNWWEIKHEVSIEVSEIKQNSKIKVYLWNIDKKKAYIDNFNVEIFGM